MVEKDLFGVWDVTALMIKQVVKNNYIHLELNISQHFLFLLCVFDVSAAKHISTSANNVLSVFI